MNFTVKEHDEILTVTLGITITRGDLLLLRSRLWDLVDGRNMAVVLDLKDLLSLDTGLVSFIIELKKSLTAILRWLMPMTWSKSCLQ
jgi:hypothetical protein